MQKTLFDEPLHRERDRPKSIKPGHWSALIDAICVRGGVRFTESGLLENLHLCCPEHRTITRLSDLDLVAFSHWEWHWQKWRPDVFNQ